MNDIDYLELKGEFLLRQNHNIIRPIKVIIGDTTNATKKYKWTSIYNCTDQSQNRTCMTLRLEVFNTSLSDEGIYSCYVTLHSQTKQESVNLYTNKTENLSNYVIVRQTEAPVSLIPHHCCKYGFGVFEEESLLNRIQLRPNESAYYPLSKAFYTNKGCTNIFNPWVSFEGCYNYTMDEPEEMDCTNISVTKCFTGNRSLPLIGITKNERCILLDQSLHDLAEKVSYYYCGKENTDSGKYIQLFSIIDSTRIPTFIAKNESSCNATYIELDKNKLWGFPCSDSQRCSAFCLQQDGSNATYHGYIRWKEATDTCNRLNKSLPGINSNFLNTTLDKNNNTLICLAVYQTSSIVFRPVIKQVTNINSVTAVQPRNSARNLPFLCRVITDSEKPRPCVSTSETENKDTGVLTKTNRPLDQRNIKQIIIIAPSAVGFLLIVVVVSCVIHRIKKKGKIQRDQQIINTGVLYKKHIYSHKVDTEEAEPVSENIKREPDNNIDQFEEDYSKLHSADKNEFNKMYLDDEYAMTEGGCEYDVLNSKRENQEASADANIYDRTNNSVSGIYDTTLQTPDNDTYNL